MACDMEMKEDAYGLLSNSQDTNRQTTSSMLDQDAINFADNVMACDIEMKEDACGLLFQQPGHQPLSGRPHWTKAVKDAGTSSSISEFIELAVISHVMVGGGVQCEALFSHLKFVKDDLLFTRTALCKLLARRSGFQRFQRSFPKRTRGNMFPTRTPFQQARILETSSVKQTSSLAEDEKGGGRERRIIKIPKSEMCEIGIGTPVCSVAGNYDR
eukprot:gene4928-34700_t